MAETARRVPIKIHRGNKVHYLGTADARDASRIREAARREYDATGRVQRARSVYADPRTNLTDGDARLWFWSHFHAGRQLTPEQRLLLAVVEDARSQLFATSRSRRLEARAWFESDDRSYLYSFATICDAFDIDPVFARKGLFGNG